jgi:hypothetical protein
MKTLLVAPISALGLLSGIILISTAPASAQISPERQPTPPLPPAPKFTEAQIDAEMAKIRYYAADISTFTGRADPDRPGTQTMTFLRPGHWAVVAFPIFGNCEISVSYKIGFNEPDTPANMGFGFAAMTFDTTRATSVGANVMIKVTDNTPQIGCPYRVKAYVKP